MFLVDSGQAAADWDGTLAAINTVLKRADAEVVCLRKWGERKLAYEIDHKGRGTYVLCYFKADGSHISGIERDVQLSERIMRVLVLSTEDRPTDIVERDVAGVPIEPPQPEVTREPAPTAGRRVDDAAPDVGDVGKEGGDDDSATDALAGQ